jgi:hypothetical protein
MSLGSWQDTCSLCNRSRFWPSRSGYFVCAICTPDVMEALAVLARRKIGAVQQVRQWLAEASVDDA